MTSVDAALAWYMERLAGTTPTAIGIDTPLLWETHNGGWRGPDLWLQSKYPAVRQSVVCTNGARGAMVVQGPAPALRLRSCYPHAAIHLNETHPKVLYHALTKRRYPPRTHRAPMASEALEWLSERVLLEGPAERMSSDEWGVVISAWATLQGLDGIWQRDLFSLAECPIFPAGPATYFWPE